MNCQREPWLAYFPKVSTNHAPVWEAPLQTNLVAKGTNAFWSPNGGYMAINISDTKVVFDADSQRFFVIMQENPPGNRSFLNIAVSRTFDPRSGSTADCFFIVMTSPTPGHFRFLRTKMWVLIIRDWRWRIAPPISLLQQ